MSDDNKSTTLVLIPGLLSDARVWQAVADSLTGRLQIHAADISAMLSIPAAAQQILTETEGPLLVAGHSLGGRIALDMARQAPERLVGLILADTGTHPRAPGETAKRRAMMDLAHAQGMKALADRWLPPMVHPAFHDDHRLMSSLEDMVLQASAEQHDRQMKALLDRPDGSRQLPELTCPVLVLVGRQDQWSPVSQHERMHDTLADSELFIVEDAGHFAPVEQPAAVADAIVDWVERRIPA